MNVAPILLAPPKRAEEAPGLPYGVLGQTHDEYDAGLIDQVDVLYEGGYAVMRRARELLVKLVGEGDERFEERVQTATYQNYFGQVIGQFVSDLFAQGLTVVPAADAKDPNTPGEWPDEDYYTAFAKDADGCGTPFIDVAEQVMVTALKHRRAVMAVDAPSVSPDAAINSKADEDAVGANRLYVYELPIAELVDWDLDEHGHYLWAIRREKCQKRQGPRGTRGRVEEIFTLWEAALGRAVYSRYRIEYAPDKPPKDADVVPLVEGPVVTRFPHVPYVRVELPKGLWVGNKIGPPALEHFRRRSSLVGAENRSLCAIPVAALGAEIPAPGGAISQNQESPERGNDPVKKFYRKGYVVTGRDDKVYFAEPAGTCYGLLDAQLKELRDDIFSVNHQMAAGVRPTTTALGRSGLSKQKDQEKTAKVLGALGEKGRRHALKVYDLIAETRGEDVSWTAHGLDGFEHEERPDILAESIQMDQVSIPSPTFKKLHKYQVAKKLVPTVDPQTLSTIRDEIEKGVDREEELRQATLDAKQEAIENPPPPMMAPAFGAKPQLPPGQSLPKPGGKDKPPKDAKVDKDKKAPPK